MKAKKRLVIPKKYHRYILGKRGQRWKELENKTLTKIQVPSLTDQVEAIVITGTQEGIRKAETELRLICKEMDSIVTLECFIESKYRSRALGFGGSNVQAIREKFHVHIQFPQRVAEEDSEEVETPDTASLVDTVQISGPRDNAEAARKALLNLIPITIQVDFPHNLHYLLIGRNGCGVKELKEKYDVSLLMSRPHEKLDYIQIIGLRECVEEAKKGILEKREILKAELQEKTLKSFKLKFEVDSEYFPAIVGREGVVIKKIISDHDVVITFPRIGDPEENVITIIGYEKNTYNVRDDIMKLIDEQKPKPNVVFGQFVPTTPDKPAISSSESFRSSSLKTESSCEATNFQGDTEELVFNGEFDSGEEDESEKSVQEEEEEKEVPLGYEELDRNLYVSWISKFDLNKSMALIREHVDLVTEALRSTGDTEKQFQDMYTDVTSKQQKEILDLRKRLNDEVSLNKALRNKLTQLMLEAENEREEREKIIHDNEQKHSEKTKILSYTIEDLEKQLSTEREENSKLIEENNESSSKNLKFIAEIQEMEASRDSMEADWKSRVAGLYEVIKNQTDVLNELKNKQSQTREDENLKFERKQLDKLTEEYVNAIGELDRVTSFNEELVKDLATLDEKMNTLNTVLRNKDHEIQKTKTDLSILSVNNEKLSKTVESLNEELSSDARKISEIEMELESYRANVDEHVMRQVAHHEVRFERIKSNVCDLKETLDDIMKNLYDSSSTKICGMSKNARDIQSDKPKDTSWRKQSNLKEDEKNI